MKKYIFAFIVGLKNYFLGSTSVLTILLKKKKVNEVLVICELLITALMNAENLYSLFNGKEI